MEMVICEYRSGPFLISTRNKCIFSISWGRVGRKIHDIFCYAPWKHEKTNGFICFFNVLGPGPALQEGHGSMKKLMVSYVFSMFWGPGQHYGRAMEACRKLMVSYVFSMLRGPGHMDPDQCPNSRSLMNVSCKIQLPILAIWTLANAQTAAF